MTKNEVFDILREELGAMEELRKQFHTHYPKCGKFHFTGKLFTHFAIHRTGAITYENVPTTERDTLVAKTEASLKALASAEQTTRFHA
jgi:hypothetical protein